MATVIAVYNLAGCAGRCDAKCHKAKGFDCKCICGGALHGVGTKIAQEDRGHLSDEEILAEGQRFSSGGYLRLFRPAEQLELFS